MTSNILNLKPPSFFNEFRTLIIIITLFESQIILDIACRIFLKDKSEYIIVHQENYFLVDYFHNRIVSMTNFSIVICSVCTPIWQSAHDHASVELHVFPTEICYR